MPQVQDLLRFANQKINTSDHLTYITYPTVNENKLMISIVENIFVGMTAGMDALLLYERTFKRVPMYADDFRAKVELLKSHAADRYNLDRKYIIALEDLRMLIEAHKKSTTEISHREKFVIFSDTYQMKALTIENVKSYLALAKSFMDKVNKVLANAGRY